MAATPVKSPSVTVMAIDNGWNDVPLLLVPPPRPRPPNPLLAWVLAPEICIV